MTETDYLTFVTEMGFRTCARKHAVTEKPSTAVLIQVVSQRL